MSDKPRLEPYAKNPLPNYEVEPLKKDIITVAALQVKLTTVEVKNPKPDIRKKIDHVLGLIDLVQMRNQVDLFSVPEFALSGSSINKWTRDEFLNVAIEFPGEETELICRKAREQDCYIQMAAYTREPDWPGHFFNCSFLVSPAGKIIHRHWKAHWDPGLFEHSTSVHDVFDDFIERYGWDEVWPVARTDIGNIATFICSEGMQPETARAFAFKGAEILSYSMSGGAVLGIPRWGDVRVTIRAHCITNEVYGIFTNNAIGETNEYMFEDAGAGYSMIIDNVGRVLKEATSQHEVAVVEKIPIAQFRANHSIPPLRKELYSPVYNEYEGKYPPNLYTKYLPKDNLDALNYARREARW